MRAPRPSRGLSLALAALGLAVSLSLSGCPAPAPAGPPAGAGLALEPGWHYFLEGRWDVVARWHDGALLETHERHSGHRWMVVNKNARAGGSGSGGLSVEPVELELVPLQLQTSDRGYDYQVFRLTTAQGIVAVPDLGFGAISPDWCVGPDGRTAAFCLANLGIWVADLSAAKPSAKLVTSETWEGKTRAEIAASRPKGDSERGLSWAEFIGWSPDGRWIYYLTGRDAADFTYWRVSPDGAAEERLGTLRGRPVWTPSGVISVEDPLPAPGETVGAYPYGIYTASGRLFFVGKNGHLCLSSPAGDGEAEWDSGLRPLYVARRFLRRCLSADGKVLRFSTSDAPGVCFVTEDKNVVTWTSWGESNWASAIRGGWAPTGTRYAVVGPRGAYVIDVAPTEATLVAAIPCPPFDVEGRYILDLYWLDSSTLIVHVPPDVKRGHALLPQLTPQTWIYVLPPGE